MILLVWRSRVSRELPLLLLLWLLLSLSESIVAAAATCRAVCGGDRHVCILDSDGSVRCHGYGGMFALGTGSAENIGDSAAHKVTSAPLLQLGNAGEHATHIACGGWTTCVALNSGVVKCIGYNTVRIRVRIAIHGAATTTRDRSSVAGGQPTARAPPAHPVGVAVGHCGERSAAPDDHRGHNCGLGGFSDQRISAVGEISRLRSDFAWARRLRRRQPAWYSGRRALLAKEKLSLASLISLFPMSICDCMDVCLCLVA